MIKALKYCPVLTDKDYPKLRVGTIEHRNWWSMQKNRILNGYKPTGGTWIPGNYYFYLNFGKIHGLPEGAVRKTMISPIYRDQDHEYFTAVDKAKKDGQGIIVLKARRKGFQQPHSEVVMTPNGESTMGEMKVGSKVLTPEGGVANVLKVFPQGKSDVYEMTLYDGRTVRCGYEHLWTVYNKVSRGTRRIETLETNELIERGLKDKYGYKFYLKVNDPIPYDKEDYKISPYVIGAILGDGNVTKQFKLSGDDDHIFDRVLNELNESFKDEGEYIIGSTYEYNRQYKFISKDRSAVARKYGVSQHASNPNPAYVLMDKLGVCIKSKEKFIPEMYKRGAVEQRTALVQGLMDTDGHIMVDGSMSYSTMSKQLAEDLRDVLYSIGIACSIKRKKDGTYIVYIYTNKPIFSLKRKHDRIREGIKRKTYIPILSITKLDYQEESSCIMIDSKDKLYLTKSYIPTHNSFMNVNILLHEWTCYAHSENGLGAQKAEYVEDFRKKLLLSYNELPGELKNKILHNNEDIMMSGYKQKENGIWVERGIKSMMHFRVMDKPNAFRGTSLNYMVFEEAGEFNKLRRAYQANEECFREGARQFGTPIIGGTANQINVDSDDFMEMFYNAADYNLVPIFIPASKVYAGYFDTEYGKSDVKNATIDIVRRAEAKKKGNVLENYYAFLQEMPLKPEDAFTKSGSTPFDLDKINKQIANINTNKNFQVVQRGKLDWAKDEKGREIFGSKPTWIMDDGNLDEDNPDRDIFPYEIVEHPIEGYKNIHVAAVDPYHVDDEFEEIKTSKKSAKEAKDRSKGCMCVHRRFVSPDIVGEQPVAFYTDRPYSKQEFYENCLKLAIYYDSQILVEYNDDGFLKYFTSNKMTMYLKERPTSADSPWSIATNRYGIHMKSFQKKRLTELVDEYIKDHWEDVFFLKLLNEFSVYGKQNTDRVMAFGMALIHDMDTNKQIIDTKEEESKDKDFVPHFTRDNNGNIVSHYSEKNDNFGNTKRSPNFNYNLD